MRKRQVLTAIFYSIALLLVICFGLLLRQDAAVRYPFGSAPFYLYVTERAIKLLVPALLCFAAARFMTGKTTNP